MNMLLADKGPLQAPPPLAPRFRWGDGWVEVSIASAADAAHARWLFELNYDRLRGATRRDLLARVAAAGSQAGAR